MKPFERLRTLFRSATAWITPLRERMAEHVLLSLLGFAILLAGAWKAWHFFFPSLPASVQVYDVMRLRQGWSEDERERYYQTSQGTLIIPYTWFFALEQPPTLKLIGRFSVDNEHLLSDRDFLSRYRLLPDPFIDYNPDRLPIGITKEVIADNEVEHLGLGQKVWLSYSCAACHTGQITYKGLGIRIDGGTSLWNFTQFNTLMANSLMATNAISSKFDRFAGRVLRMDHKEDTPANRDRVRHDLNTFLNSTIVKNGINAIFKGTYPTEEGYGRMDALGRGANGQFSQLDQRNIHTADAPVSIPPVWYTHEFDWVQSPALINQPLGRNITESWGVNAGVDLTNPDPAKRFTSTQSLYKLVWMETLVSVLERPRWPRAALGPVDTTAAARGKALYEDTVWADAPAPAEEELFPNPDRPRKGLCARCHAPFLSPAGTYADGKRFVQLPMIKLSVLGTDPRDAANFAARTVYTGPLKDALFDGQEQVGVGVALAKTTTQILNKKWAELNIPADQQPELAGFRPNNFRAPLAYPARPLAGYWATAPFLHNGSVPNIYQLLSPVEERDRAFYIGNPEFDPTKLGYSTAPYANGFKFTTRRTFAGASVYWVQTLFEGSPTFSREVAGNSNAGHEFRNAPKGTPGVIGPALTEQNRTDLIEYLKILADMPPLAPEELARRRKLLTSLAPHLTDPTPP